MRAWVHELPELCDINLLPIYEVDEHGNVYSHSGTKCGSPRKQSDNGRGYCFVGLRTCERKYFNALVHRLVAIAFVAGYEEGLQVDHVDGNNKNNHASNLRWVTPYENTHNLVTFERFIEANRKSKNAKETIVVDNVTGKQKTYPSENAALLALSKLTEHYRCKGHLQRPYGRYTMLRLEDVE